MKKLIQILAIFICVSTGYAQTKTENQLKTVEITVGGKCGMCKSRIEKTAKIDGVNFAEWKSETQKLTLKFNPQKVNLDDLEKKIAAVGHDTDNHKADDKVYNNLPACCKYERLKVKNKIHKH
jgi:copper chaperone CopZ